MPWVVFIRPSSAVKTLTLDITRKLFRNFVCIPAVLLGTKLIDFYHITPLSQTGGHKASEKQNLLALFLAHISSDQNEIWSDEMCARKTASSSHQDEIWCDDEAV